ncbi:MAG: hypothetical protein QXN16_00650 [Candidatus Micrarchaeaceae archaeon]
MLLYTPKKYREEVLKAWVDEGVFKHGSGDYYYIVEAADAPQINIFFFKTRAAAEKGSKSINRGPGNIIASRVYHLSKKQKMRLKA